MGVKGNVKICKDLTDGEGTGVYDEEVGGGERAGNITKPL